MATKPAPLDHYGQPEIPPDIERRRDNAALLLLVQKVLDGLEDIKHELKTHIAEETEQFAEISNAAYPGGDPIGHRRWHEADIKHLEERAEFWRIMKTEISKWGLIGFLGFAAVALWTHFLKGPQS